MGLDMSGYVTLMAWLLYLRARPLNPLIFSEIFSIENQTWLKKVLKKRKICRKKNWEKISKNNLCQKFFFFFVKKKENFQNSSNTKLWPLKRIVLMRGIQK